MFTEDVCRTLFTSLDGVGISFGKVSARFEPRDLEWGERVASVYEDPGFLHVGAAIKGCSSVELRRTDFFLSLLTGWRVQGQTRSREGLARFSGRYTRILPNEWRKRCHATPRLARSAQSSC